MDAAESVEYATELANIARAEVLADYLRLRLVREVIVPPPGAGAEWAQAVPSGAIWEVLQVSYTFTTSAVVANRNSTLRVRDGDGAQVTRFYAGSNQAASNAVIYTYAAGLGLTAVSVTFQMGLPSPPLALPSGWSLGSQTGALDAGDAYSGLSLIVREWSIGQVYWLADLVARDLSFEAQRERRA